MSEPSQRDDSGRDRLLRNVVAGWWAHGVTVVVGFLMPRLIYESVGQTALGVWDIGWSLVTFVAYSGLGLSSAVTHYVARYRAEDSLAGIRRTTAAAWYTQAVLAVAAGAVFTALFASLHWWLPSVDDFARSELLLIGILLGLAIVVGLLGAVAQGVLSGCHRGSWNEYLAIGADIALALAMVAVLVAGWGIVGLAAATLGVRLLSECLRLGIAARTCEGFSLRPWDATWAWAKTLFIYGTKTSTGLLQELSIHQLSRLALAASAGPVAVAVYSRYTTLIRQIGRSVDRVAQILSPMTSSMVGLGLEADIRRFSLQASKAAVMMMLPMIVVFGVFGDRIVTLWMGPDFVVPGLAWVLAVMAFLHSDRGVTTHVLSGLDSHGRISLACLIAALLVMALAVWALYPLEPLSAGIVMAVSTVIGVTIPHFVLACRRLEISYLEHLRYVYLKPLISNTVFMIILGLSNSRLGQGDYLQALLLAAVAAWVLAALYWYFAFDRQLRARVRQRFLPRLAG